MATGSALVSPLNVVILIPIRDDWVSVVELLRRLGQAVPSNPYVIDVLLVDDCSVETLHLAEVPSQFAAFRSIRILRLRRNLGHQRAIAIGLVHIETQMACDAVLVMDGDGEDTPEGALQLLNAFSGEEAVFAKRSRRTESIVFRVFYQAYKLLHRVFTGVRVQVGNFSVLPLSHLHTLVVMPELWNHYAAAVIRSGLPLTMTPIPRGHRIAGSSKMNVVSLTTHGMSAISVFGDVVGVRLLIASMAGAAMAFVGIVTVIWIRVFTRLAIPGWATYGAGALVIILIQFVTIASSFTFTFLSNRINLSFVPLRDCGVLVEGFRDVYLNG
jgi:glycosyltransferase involved in cell wall biosynthesis